MDLLQYEKGDAKVPDEEFLRRHTEALAQQQWVVDGFGTPHAFEAVLHAADVLVYFERSSMTHYWWVTKRILKSPFAKPLGWPEGSPILRSTISSYRFLRLSGRFWTPAFKARLLALRPRKRVYVVRRQSDVISLLAELEEQAISNEARALAWADGRRQRNQILHDPAESARPRPHQFRQFRAA